MKFRLLDTRNCHALLPEVLGLPLIQRLEECLRQINDTQGVLQGSIDALIMYYNSTREQACGSKRLCNSPIEIAQVSDVVSYYGGPSTIVPIPLSVFIKMVEDSHNASYIPEPKHIKRFFERSNELANSANNEIDWYNGITEEALTWLTE